MIEDIDYSENLDWAKCLICQTPASFEDITDKLKEKNISIKKSQYKKICKELGFR